jgi:hypothetical protein
MKTLRLHPAEIAIIDGACDVLEIDRATLLTLLRQPQMKPRSFRSLARIA